MEGEKDIKNVLERLSIIEQRLKISRPNKSSLLPGCDQAENLEGEKVIENISERISICEQQLKTNEQNKSDLLPGYDHDDYLVAPPVLGDEDRLCDGALSALKILNEWIGNDQFCLEDLNSPPLRNMLPIVAKIITKHKLNDANAYLCLLRTLKGDLHVNVSYDMVDKAPFHDCWRMVQVLANSNFIENCRRKGDRKDSWHQA